MIVYSIMRGKHLTELRSHKIAILKTEIKYLFSTYLKALLVVCKGLFLVKITENNTLTVFYLITLFEILMKRVPS